MPDAPFLKVKEIAIYERRLTMRISFRFGAATKGLGVAQNAAQATFQTLQSEEKTT
ncbi:hypothetical protein [Agrobacterium bohemicum]|uniref:hypothetical protein n=1 Tax=Agrobacterium bohemicum TaxID=2052828 RepID=UPI000A9E6E21|nr:hypothetical protein [Agrobacterium bohemicum]